MSPMLRQSAITLHPPTGYPPAPPSPPQSAPSPSWAHHNQPDPLPTPPPQIQWTTHFSSAPTFKSTLSFHGIIRPSANLHSTTAHSVAPIKMNIKHRMRAWRKQRRKKIKNKTTTYPSPPPHHHPLNRIIISTTTSSSPPPHHHLRRHIIISQDQGHLIGHNFQFPFFLLWKKNYGSPLQFSYLLPERMYSVAKTHIYIIYGTLEYM